MSETRIISLGCRLNSYEAEVMRQEAGRAGLTEAVIINTCAVTAEAVRQAQQAIRRARRDTPGARIVVTGCAAQIEPERFAAMAEVDHVIGNGEKTKSATWDLLAAHSLERVKVDDIMSVRETAGHLIDGFGTKARAYVEIQNGCDHRCTFCIIPFGRGPSRSVGMGEVVTQVRRLVENGHAEIVLTGVDITSWGADLPGTPKLGRLVRQILRLVPELQRLRLSSIDQVEVDDELVAAMAEEERLMPHLHLSLQAGADLILKRMRRRHLRADAIRFCAEVRRRRPDVAFGADLIAGFPTESEEHFAETLDLIDACGLAYIHAFPFSPRKGTPAARMPQLSREIVKERAQRLRSKGDTVLAGHLSVQVGRSIKVLIERDGIGRAPDFSEVALDQAPVAARSLAVAQLEAHDGRRLIGRIAA